MNKQNFENQEISISQYDLEDFRQEITFPIEKLQEIVYNDCKQFSNEDKYTSAIIGFLHQGYTKVKREELQHALVCFNQAQKILEYGASCGRVIDRNLIICVLHNQGCCYQKLGNLTKATKYIEAIIFNLKAHLKSLQISPTSSNIIESSIIQGMPQFNRVGIRKKLQLAQYYLEYCSITSQTKVRKSALQSAKTALNLYKKVIMEIKMENHYISNLNYAPTNDQTKMRNTMKEYKPFKDDIKTDDLEEYVRITKYCIIKWKCNIKSNPKTIIDKLYKSYSINNLVQLQSMEYSEHEAHNSSIFQPEDIVKQFLHFSMGYFQLAAEERLVAEEKYKSDEKIKLQSEEFIYSQIHHLLAIIMIALYVPYDILYMEQIQTSYQHHYPSRLAESLPQHYQPKKQIFFFCEQKKRILSRKRKNSQNKVNSKRKKSLGSTIKVSNSKLKGTQNPTTAQDQYFAEGMEENRRMKRISSTNSKNGNKKRKLTSSIDKINENRRQRMKTKNDGENYHKKQEKPYDEYCAMPTPFKTSTKQSIYKAQHRERGSRLSSKLSVDDKCSVLKKGSEQRYKGKEQKKKYRLLSSKLSTHKQKDKKGKNTKGYYL